jgi:hypothetical protein
MGYERHFFSIREKAPICVDRLERFHCDEAMEKYSPGTMPWQAVLQRLIERRGSEGVL